MFVCTSAPLPCLLQPISVWHSLMHACCVLLGFWKMAQKRFCVGRKLFKRTQLQYHKLSMSITIYNSSLQQPDDFHTELKAKLVRDLSGD